MQYNSQELQNIFGKDIKKLSVSNVGKATRSQFSLSFFGKKIKDSNIRMTENKMSSITFSVDGKENLDLLNKIIEKYEFPRLALEANLFPSSNMNEELGTFGFGKISSTDFVFDKSKLGEYIYYLGYRIFYNSFL